MRDITMKKPIEQDNTSIHDLRRNDRIQHGPATEGNIYDKQQIAWPNIVDPLNNDGPGT